MASNAKPKIRKSSGKDQGFEKLKQLHRDRSSLPDYAKPPYSKRPTTTGGMTQCVIDYIIFSGDQAERVSSSGRYIEGEKVLDVLGHVRQMKGKYIPGTGTEGTADISATKAITVWRKQAGTMTKVEVGIKVAIEVKNRDRQSPAQKKYQEQVEAAGGVYVIAYVGAFDLFVKDWDKI